jgi:hypothetical protein
VTRQPSEEISADTTGFKKRGEPRILEAQIFHHAFLAFGELGRWNRRRVA